MNTIHYLYAAYIATGMIHLGYLGTLAIRYRKVQKRLQTLNQPR